MGTIILDRGHVDITTDPGAIGLIVEAEETHEWGLLLQQQITRLGGTAVIAPDGTDWLNDLYTPVAFQKQYGPDSVFCSLHFNCYYDPAATGFEVLVQTGYAVGSTLALAQGAHNAIKSVADKYGLRDRGIKQQDVHVLRETNCDAILIEFGFISNPNDVSIINDNAFRDEVITNLAIALMKRANQNIIEYSPLPQIIVPSFPAQSKKVDAIYQAYVSKAGWLPNVANQEDYAGLPNLPIRGICANASQGELYYRVHIKNKGWLPWVINREDYAGTLLLDKDIDGVQMNLVGVPGRQVKYRVSLIGTAEYLPTVTGYNNDNEDGYAGVYGQSFDELQVWIE